MLSFVPTLWALFIHLLVFINDFTHIKFLQNISYLYEFELHKVLPVLLLKINDLLKLFKSLVNVTIKFGKLYLLNSLKFKRKKYFPSKCFLSITTRNIMNGFEHQLTKTLTERLEYTTFLWYLLLALFVFSKNIKDWMWEQWPQQLPCSRRWEKDVCFWNKLVALLN